MIQARRILKMSLLLGVCERIGKSILLDAPEPGKATAMAHFPAIRLREVADISRIFG